MHKNRAPGNPAIMPHDSETGLLSLVDSLYQAVIDPSCWPDAWQAVIRDLNGTSGSLFAETPQGIEPFAFNGFSAKALSLYAEYYAKTDPWLCLIGRQVLGRTTLTQEYVPAETFEASETWQDFSRLHVGAFHAMGSGIILPDGTTGMFALHRTKSMDAFDEADATRMDRLVPHLRNAMHLARMARQHAALHRRGHAVLEAFGTGAMVLDAAGLVVFANRAAEALTRKGPLRMAPALDRRHVGVPALRLASPSAAETARLHALIAQAARGGPGGAMRLADEAGAVLRILVTPLPDALADGPGPGRALLLAEDLAVARALPLDILNALYGLSRAEAGVAGALLAGRTAEQVAADRHVALPTIRSQIRAILDKTGARSIRDIARFIQAP
jgi:DNA-binding CsgD family transcriptional regulator/PAS domain-containing protein